jgi:hypothetical protein
MYVDGRQYTSLPMGPLSATVTDVKVLIGASQHESAPNWHFNGVIMEMRIWSGARSLAQIAVCFLSPFPSSIYDLSPSVTVSCVRYCVLQDARKRSLTSTEEKLFGYWPLMGRAECIRDAIGSGTLDRALKMPHHGIRYRLSLPTLLSPSFSSPSHSLSF